MIKAVVFDLDDTLYPETEYVKSGFRQVANYLYSYCGKDFYNQMLELFEISKTDVFNRLIDENDINIKVEGLLKIYRNHSPEISFYPDVLPFLNDLKLKKIKTGIITDGRPEGQRAKLSALKCWNLFDKIIITDELGGIEYRKPNPLSYELMAKDLNINYNEMIYIGDNPNKDFDIKKTHPITTVWIKRKGSVIYSNNSYNISPNYIIASLHELNLSKY